MAHQMQPRKMHQGRSLLLINLIALATFAIFLYFFRTDSPDIAEKSKPVADRQFAERSTTKSTSKNEQLKMLIETISMTNFRATLNPILIERVVGTPGHETVKNYITDQMTKLQWFVENDTFHDRIPNGSRLQFTNLIATRNPEAAEFLVLACHYDSKLSAHTFIGATDSAVPCAMLIYLAKNMAAILPQLEKDVSLKFIFFDGEEAFVEWSNTDSLYGARHLAKVLEQKHSLVGSPSRSVTDIQRMSLFVLLDLLGASSPQFFSFFRNTDKWYSALVAIEESLVRNGLLKNDLVTRGGTPRRETYFKNQAYYSARIDDDHKPFLRKGEYIYVISDILAHGANCFSRPLRPINYNRLPDCISAKSTVAVGQVTKINDLIRKSVDNIFKYNSNNAEKR